jgi:hypothetical protein
METLLLIAAFWLVLLGVYGAFFLPKNAAEAEARHRARAVVATVATTYAPGRRPAIRQNLPELPASTTVTEVELLRAQVEQLRSEILALSSGERTQRRSRKTPAPVADLPQPLRRQVREVRSTRKLVRA